jgi:glycyl-tRNA synthetase beta subunit
MTFANRNKSIRNLRELDRFNRMEDARERIHNLLLTGDNRLKQGVSAEKVRASYEEALAVAREAGLEEQIRPLVEVRLADLERLAGESPPPSPPAA